MTKPKLSCGDRQLSPMPTHAYTIGITYRQWLTGMALKGFCASGGSPTDAARDAIACADEVVNISDLEEPKS